jgi:hypothetical protein
MTGDDNVIIASLSARILAKSMEFVELLKQLYPDGPDQTTFEVLAVGVSVVMGRFAQSTELTVEEVAEQFFELVSRYNNLHKEEV